MRYAKSRLDADVRDFAYRIFITDCIGKIIGLNERYYDMIQPKKIEETRTADEIIGNIRSKLAK